MQQWYKIYSNILYMYFSPGFYNLPESAKNAASPKSPLMRLLKIAGYTVVRLFGNLFQSPERREKLQGKIWLYVVSQNNYDSLQFITDHLLDAVLVAGQNKQIGKYNQQVERVSLRRKICYYYKFLPILMRFWKDKSKSTARFFDILYDAIGFHEVYLRKLQKYKPVCIVFANDHTPDARAMLLAAKSIGIKTIYIQHASVSQIFPPLQFDLNLLEGQDSLNKYKACGPVSGQVELIGMPKADAYVKFRNSNTEIRTIGIGANIMDLTEEVQKVLETLSHSFPELYLILRPHPRDKRDFSFANRMGGKVNISDGSIVPTFEFLRQIDVLISGNSGIHLEAVLLNVWSIYYNFNTEEKLQDYYGYVENGLSDQIMSADKLISLLKEHLYSKPEVFIRAKFYNATLGTEWDGRSGELALKHIGDLLQHQ